MLCSYAISGKEAIQQSVFICLTCQKKNECCCLACSKTCHEGHNVKYLAYGLAYWWDFKHFTDSKLLHFLLFLKSVSFLSFFFSNSSVIVDVTDAPLQRGLTSKPGKCFRQIEASLVIFRRQVVDWEKAQREEGCNFSNLN